MFTFKKGTVKLEAKPDQKYGDSPFQLVFASDNHNGWGITKDVSATEAKNMNRAKAGKFYSDSLNFLGVGE